jgi:hypothetical protein
MKDRRDISPVQLEALKLIRDFTRWHFNFTQRLTGNHRRKQRQMILSVLLGRKVTTAQCGINVLRKEVYAAFGVKEDCLAGQEREFVNWAKELFFGPSSGI